ncbi:helix-turn-helix domain-containing protein [[Mycobacterium] burgundiense]|uniref:AraC family transcriptional regulator n=1 Tax=[Mycobacterium] burgundiense TaxID=3064286 RepID=A0ABM9LUM0_9MYCO|nr:AraC family transcriptional regulator [Mycolicibacterium sp. MU0053]CAJ1504959.1 AraC family transcriptional regulator [Mycolicibacterium sp. MU0053]
MAMDTVQIEQVSTRGLEPAEGRELWTERLMSYESDFDCSFAPTWMNGSAVRARTSRFQYVSWRCDSTSYRRTSHHISKDRDLSARLMVPRRGSLTVTDDEKTVVVHAGQAYPISMARPVLLRHGPDAELLAMALDSEMLARRLYDLGGPAQPIDLRSGLGSSVHALLSSLIRESEVLAAHEFDAVADRLIDLFALTQERVAADVAPGRLHEVACAARRYIQQHLGDRDLSVHHIAAALGWSPRQVQLALKHVGTTTNKLIKDERLSAAYAVVVAPGASSTITELATELGFSTPSAFSTAFRERYGLSPRRLREQSRNAALNNG